MAFCSKCGAQVGAGMSFCGSCGTPVSGPAPGGPPAAPVPGASTSGMSSNVAGLLTYVLGFITGIIFLVIEPYKNDKFVRFHAFQSIFLSAAWIVLRIALSVVVGTVSGATGGLGGLAFLPIWALLSLASVALWIFLMYKAYNNERFMLPVIGPLAAMQAG